MWVKGLSEPVCCDEEKKPVSNFIHSSRKPFLVDFKGVIAQIHSVRDNKVDHRVEVTVKHTSVNVENAEPFFE